MISIIIVSTTGPNPATVQDFWRMVWQENVAVIVISANLVEDGKVEFDCPFTLTF